MNICSRYSLNTQKYRKVNTVYIEYNLYKLSLDHSHSLTDTLAADQPTSVQ